jgi:hypothetical protein
MPVNMYLVGWIRRNSAGISTSRTVVDLGAARAYGPGPGGSAALL